MSWAAGDTPSQITGGGGSRMPWATHWKCNGETPPRNTGEGVETNGLGLLTLWVYWGYSFAGGEAARLKATHSSECTGDTPLHSLGWSGSSVLRPLTPTSVPDGNSFVNCWGALKQHVKATVETLP